MASARGSPPRMALPFTLLALLATFVAQAEARTATVFAEPSCKDWIADFAAIKKDEPYTELSSIADTRWVLGFISAMNLTIPNSRDALQDVNLKLVQDWMSTYCVKHIDKRASDGAIDLYLRLVKVRQ